MQYEDTSEWLTQGSSQDFKSMKMVKVDRICATAVGEKKLSIYLPFKKKKKKETTWFLFKCHLPGLCGGNEMRGWSLAHDNEVKGKTNLSPVGFRNINN